MQLAVMAGLVAVLVFLLVGLLRDWWPQAARPLYLQVEDDAENIEWLLISLLKAAPRAELILIDHTRGENKQIIKALARRYHLYTVQQAPDGEPLLYLRRGIKSEDLLAQYLAQSDGRGQEIGPSSRKHYTGES